MPLDQDYGEVRDVLRLTRGESAGPDDRLDVLHREVRHRGGLGGPFKKGRRNLVDPLIGALGRQEDRHQEGEGIPVI